MLRLIVAPLFYSLVTFQAIAQQIPQLTGPVVDQAGVMSTKHKSVAEALIRSFYQQGFGQLQVLTVKSLGGFPIENYSIKAVEEWKLGGSVDDKGLLLLVALEEKKIRIEVGQGFEGALPDVVAKRIIEDQMRPVFRSEGPSSGILLGLSSIIKTIQPNFDLKAAGFKAMSSEPKNKRSFLGLIMIVLFIIIFFSGPRGRDFLLFALIMGSGRRSYGSFGRGGGGWGGGGGGFSGGGASGGW